MTLQFVYSSQDFVPDVHRSSGKASTLSKFDTVLQAGWQERMDRGLFRYTLGDLQTRVLPGPLGYVSQLNIQRATDKINPEEILFEMTKNSGGGSEKGRLHQPGRIVVLVNVSPLGLGHCLFVPDPSLCLPQVLTRFAIQAGIEFVLLSADPGFHVGFNSLGALASVNHLHLHGYYLDQELKIESAPAKPLVPEKGFYRLSDFPKGFLFYAESDGVEAVARAICDVTDLLVDSNIAHNMFITRGCPPCDRTRSGEDHLSRRGVRIVIWPRMSCFGADGEPSFNTAVCELAGHVLFKNKKDYELATEKGVKDTIQKYLLPEAEQVRLAVVQL
uniref:GDP-D-glucose phosphorylase 1 n=1 Tax=Mola mola TaxID=94237 RepID=A0A3Q3XBI1_MOLML